MKLKVCDVACGSGHILLSAARRIALAVARVQTDEEQPNPLSIRKALKDVVRNCIYGVDKNPLAVELCKIALWLEAYNPGEPLNFLDHHIKCGDAIVGLVHRGELEKGIVDEAFKTLPGDEKDIAASFRKRNQLERKQKEQTALNFDATINDEVNAVIEKYNLFKNLPETSPEEVEKKAKEHIKYEQDYHRIRLKQLADAQVAQFFIPKTDANKDVLITDAEYRNLLRQVNKHLGILQSNKLVKAQIIADKNNKNFFHWFLEFPEVFCNGGFDCILGNPPYLGARLLSGKYDELFSNYIKTAFHPAIGRVDLVVYFLKRIYTVINENRFIGLITTNSISQGHSRESGLDIFLSNNNNSINFVHRNIKWPGVANVEVSLFVMYKGKWVGDILLDNKRVEKINSHFDDEQIQINPEHLFSMKNISFQGSVVLGEGFYLTEEEALKIINTNSIYSNVLIKRIGGAEINNSYDQASNDWIINFFELVESEVKSKYPLCYEIVFNKVKPERDKVKRDTYRNKWWQFAEKGINLYNKISVNKKVMVVPLVSKYEIFVFIPVGYVFLNKLAVIAYEDYFHFAIFQSSMHSYWSRKYSGTLGSSVINYSPPRCFETFPLPHLLSLFKQQLEEIGEKFHESRRRFMLSIHLGLTKTYNLFHSNAITAQSINDKDKQVASLQKHLDKTVNNISFDEAIQGILKLRELHVQMDEAVLEAYEWNDIALKHDFYEVDYLPENDRVRFTIHPDARKEVLKRLLELNHNIHEKEVEKGLWDKKGVKKKPYKTDDDIVSRVDKPDSNYGGFFNQE